MAILLSRFPSLYCGGFLMQKPTFLPLQTASTTRGLPRRDPAIPQSGAPPFLSHQAAFMTGGLPCRGINKVEIAAERIPDCHCEEKHGFDVAISTLTFAFLAMTF